MREFDEFLAEIDFVQNRFRGCEVVRNVIGYLKIVRFTAQLLPETIEFVALIDLDQIAEALAFTLVHLLDEQAETETHMPWSSKQVLLPVPCLGSCHTIAFLPVPDVEPRADVEKENIARIERRDIRWHQFDVQLLSATRPIESHGMFLEQVVRLHLFPPLLLTTSRTTQNPVSVRAPSITRMRLLKRMRNSSLSSPCSSRWVRHEAPSMFRRFTACIAAHACLSN